MVDGDLSALIFGGFSWFLLCFGGLSGDLEEIGYF